VPITTKVVSSNSVYGEVYSIQHYVIKVCQWLETGRWFSPGTPVSSSNKTDRHARYNRNTINQTSNSLHQIELTQQKHRNIRFVVFLGTLNTECQKICSINHNYDWENTYVNNWWMIKYFVQGVEIQSYWTMYWNELPFRPRVYRYWAMYRNELPFIPRLYSYWAMCWNELLCVPCLCSFALIRNWQY
jgi:hypothetical protein